MEEQEEQQKQASEGKAPKERPVWLTQSTVQGAYSEPDILKNRKWGFLSLHPVIKLLCVEFMWNYSTFHIILVALSLVCGNKDDLYMCCF